DRNVDYWLLRFFDFTVEPGKKYKYRVKLALADPNSEAMRDTLSPEVVDRLTKESQNSKDKKPAGARIVAQWSEPSPTVGIPLAGSVKLAEVKPAAEKAANDEPVVKLLVQSFDVDKTGTPIQPGTELKDLRRGAVANLIGPGDYLEAE